MRHRINVSITPVFHDELQRICKDYGFVNLCEICTALLRVFVDRVNNAEQNKGRRLERNEDLIKQMFAEFENWEPTPQPDIMYKRHQRRNPDNVQQRKPRAAADDSSDSLEDPDSSAEDSAQICDGVSVYDLDYLEKSYGPGSDDDGEQYDY